MALISPLSIGTLRKNIRKFVNIDEQYLGGKWFYMDQPVGEIRPIPSAAGYSVSSDGLVRGPSGRWTRGGEFEGYMIKGVHGYTKLVHRLVAEAFFGAAPSDDIVVNHINGKKDDNRSVNLEYCTRSENAQHAINIGLVETTKVLRICRDSGNILSEHPSIKHASTFLGLKNKSSGIGKCCLGTRTTAHGFRWSYPGESQKYAHLDKPVRKILRICKNTGEVLQEHSSVHEASNFISNDDRCVRSIRDCCRTKLNSAYGYKWSHDSGESSDKYSKMGDSNRKSVLRLSIETDEVLQKHESLTAAALFVCGNSTSIGRCCKGIQKTTGGYKWRFE